MSLAFLLCVPDNSGLGAQSAGQFLKSLRKSNVSNITHWGFSLGRGIMGSLLLLP